MERFREDLGLGFRLLLRQPGVALVAVVTLAFGIGANVTMLSFALAILDPSLPFEDPDRLVVVERHNKSSTPGEVSLVSLPAIADWKERNHVFSDFSLMFLDNSRNLTGTGGDSERLASMLVTDDIFATLGVEPILGRGFQPDDDQPGAVRTVILTHGLWQRRFGGVSEILGRAIRLDDVSYAVIGVLPAELSAEGFGSTSLGDIWLPMGLFYDVLPVHDRSRPRNWITICRLKPGVSVATAKEDIQQITDDLAREYSLSDKEKRADVVPLRRYLTGKQERVVLVLIITVILVLVIACANLINLLLTRFIARRQELAVRTALGASRGRLVSQGLSEALALALLGSLAGLLLALLLTETLTTFLKEIPYTNQARISPLILAFTALLCAVVTLAIGLVPVLQAVSHAQQYALTGSLDSHPFPIHHRLRRALVVAELALAVVLFMGMGLALATILHLRSENLGFSRHQVLTLNVALPTSRYGDIEKWTRYFDQAIDSVSLLPGVSAAAVMSFLPMAEGHRGAPIQIEGQSTLVQDSTHRARYYIVSPNFFQALGVQLSQGRTFNDLDSREAKPVVVISQSLADAFWEGRSPIGQRIAFEFGGTPKAPEAIWREIIGVAGDARYESISKPPRHVVYVTYTQRPYWDRRRTPEMALILKTDTEPARLREAARAELRKIDADQPIHDVRSLHEIVDGQMRSRRMTFVLLAILASLALTLALIGVYAVVSYMVAARSRETGIRMTLGAEPTQLMVQMLLFNLMPILVGIGAGIGLSVVMARLTASLLYKVGSLEWAFFLLGAIVLAGIALLATLVPVTQATRTDPTQLLRGP